MSHRINRFSHAAASARNAEKLFRRALKKVSEAERQFASARIDSRGSRIAIVHSPPSILDHVAEFFSAAG
jgi:hypothetical protein